MKSTRNVLLTSIAATAVVVTCWKIDWQNNRVIAAGSPNKPDAQSVEIDRLRKSHKQLQDQYADLVAENRQRRQEQQQLQTNLTQLTQTVTTLDTRLGTEIEAVKQWANNQNYRLAWKTKVHSFGPDQGDKLVETHVDFEEEVDSAVVLIDRTHLVYWHNEDHHVHSIYRGVDQNTVRVQGKLVYFKFGAHMNDRSNWAGGHIGFVVLARLKAKPEN